ncbi:NAD-dependent deacetylase sirtuin-2 [Trametopsis cervina]|nr:NAD-dependent deacetylase sirtuin-2 [Trametopsis cervina]
MGNEVSTTKFEGPSEVLKGRDIKSLAQYIKSDDCKNIYLMVGAGVSTSAGIPDFRSPETGLYANLQRLNLPYPEAVFEINFFRDNPVPFYTLARELFPGKYRPTPTHSFIKVLHNRKLMKMCFTQNIDTLERIAGVPDEAIVEAHGSFANQHCIECGSWYDGYKLKDQILRGEIAYCYECGGLVKPDIVFFGESLPQRFHNTIGKLRSADLLIVIGTSLTVHPFASLTQLVPEGCPRVLINMDIAGDFGTRADDVLLLGKSDEVVRQLCEALGPDWVEELDAMWKETEKYAKKEDEEVKGVEGVKEAQSTVTTKDEKVLAESQALYDEVDKLTKVVERALQIGEVPVPEDTAGKNAPAVASVDEKDVAESAATSTPALDEGDAKDTSSDKTESKDGPPDGHEDDKDVEGKP